jgi:hypothetical protein
VRAFGRYLPSTTSARLKSAWRLCELRLHGSVVGVFRQSEDLR